MTRAQFSLMSSSLTIWFSNRVDECFGERGNGLRPLYYEAHGRLSCALADAFSRLDEDAECNMKDIYLNQSWAKVFFWDMNDRVRNIVERYLKEVVL